MFSKIYREAGQLAFEPKMVNDRHVGSNRGRRVCVVSDTRAKKSPTADEFARWLMCDGWDVTMLDLSPHGETFKSPYVCERLAGKFLETFWHVPMQSLCAYHWLKMQSFDVIIFQHGFGAGYFTCAARHLGLAFESTQIVIVPDIPYAYWLETAERLPTSLRTELEIDHFERSTLQRADGIFLTNKDALQWMVDARWDLGNDPERIAVLDVDGVSPWGSWFASVLKLRAAKPEIPLSDISISVCIATADRPDYVRDTLKALLRQTYNNFEIIVVDSSEPGASDAVREEYATIFRDRNWQWVKQGRHGLEAARNYGASLAKGTHLLFKDDDNISLPDEIEIFMRAAQSGADLITCVTGRHPLSDLALHMPSAKFPGRPAMGGESQLCECIYNGAVLAAGITFNAFGDANTLVSWKVFNALGGRAKQDTFEDWEFHARAALAGYRFESIPEILFLYRVHSNSLAQDKNKTFSRLMGIAKVFAPTMPSFMHYWMLLHLAGCNWEQNTNPGRYPNPQLVPAAADRIPVNRAFAIHSRKTTPKIVIAATNQYLHLAGATLASLMTSVKGPIEVTIISAMTAENNDRLQSIARYFGGSLEFVRDRSSNDERIPSSGRYNFSPAALYAHLLLPEYFPNDERVIALECGMLVRRDIASLWDLDLAGSPIAAVPDIQLMGYAPVQEKVNTYCFHLGALLVDLEKWRRENVTERSLMALAEFADRMDVAQPWGQLALHKVIGNDWVKLSPTWNWLDNGYPPHDGILRYLRMDKDEGDMVMKNPAICRFIHVPQRWMSKTWWRNPYDFGWNACYGPEFDTYLKLIETLSSRTSGNQPRTA